ncbi:unnamed protein product [Amoebophrya sp. A120]|nr:unnamed protein product [Amoebophrya sp. A120]|eukprot:GSA120T00005775001.1
MLKGGPDLHSEIKSSRSEIKSSRISLLGRHEGRKRIKASSSVWLARPHFFANGPSRIEFLFIVCFFFYTENETPCFVTLTTKFFNNTTLSRDHKPLTIRMRNTCLQT